MNNITLNVSSSTGVNEKFTYKGKDDAGYYKFTFLFEKINEFEGNGWEVISSGCNGPGSTSLFFILRKEKE